jgi:hypothetical protein
MEERSAGSVRQFPFGTDDGLEAAVRRQRLSSALREMAEELTGLRRRIVLLERENAALRARVAEPPRAGRG